MTSLEEQLQTFTASIPEVTPQEFVLGANSVLDQFNVEQQAPQPEPKVEEPALRVFQNQGELDRTKALIQKNPQQIIPSIERLYGKGVAQQVFDGTYQLPEQPEKAGIIGRTFQGVQDVASGVVRGALGAGAEMAQTYENFGSINNAQFKTMVDEEASRIEQERGSPLTSAERGELELQQSMAFRNTWSMKNPFMNAKIGDADELPNYSADTSLDNLAVSGLDLRDALGKPDTIKGSVAEGLSQFVTAYATLGGGGGIVRGILAGAAADATAFEPLDANISTFLNSSENEWIKKYVPQALVKDADDTEWELRMKGSIEGAALGALIEGPIAIIKFARSVKKAKAERASTGEVSSETTAELEQLEETIQSFEDLAANGKPKGNITPDGMFTTPDGMKFDPKTGGKRRIDLEAPKTDKPVEQIQPDAPTAPKADEAPKAVDAPKSDRKPTVFPEVLPVNREANLKVAQAATSGSKVTNVVYHGSGNDAITGFKSSDYTKGLYFSPRKDLAEDYMVRRGDGTGRVYEVMLDIKNPLVIKGTQDKSLLDRIEVALGRKSEKDVRLEKSNRLQSSMVLPEKRIQELKSQGYDGIMNEDAMEYVAFEASQVHMVGGRNYSFSTSGGKTKLSAKAVDASTPKPEVTTKAPVAPATPSKIVGDKALFKAAIRGSTATNEVVPISALDLEGNDIGLFNWDNMRGPMDAIKVMDSTQQALADSGALSSRGLGEKQTLESVYNQAVDEVSDMIGAGADEVRSTYLQAEKVTRDSAQRIVAGKMLLQSTGRKINDLAQTISKAAKTGDTNTALERNLIDLMSLHTDVQASVKGIQTATARAVSAGRIRTADALSDEALDTLQQMGGSKQVQKLAKKIAAAQGNNKAQAKIIRKAGENKFWGVINEVWLNAILSGTRTHILNLGANSFNMLLRPAIRGVGGALTGNTTAMEEGARQYVYLANEVFEGIAYLATVGRTQKDSSMSAAFRALYNAEGVLDTATKFDPTLGGKKRAISAGDGNVRGNGLGKGAINLAGKVLTGSNRALTAEDELFKQMIFRSRMRAMVTTQAHKLDAATLKKMGYKDASDYISGEMGKATNSKEILAERWQKMVASGKVLDDGDAKDAFISQNLGSYNHTNRMASEALGEAREGTFTTPLRNGTFTNDMQKFIARHSWMRQIMPFVQTPTNIMRTAFERAPLLNFVMKRQRELLRTGTPDEIAILAGNQAAGVAFTFAAMSLASNGRITGGGPSFTTDSDKAKLWNASPDWQPYSVNIGTEEKPNWIELKRLDPHGMIFGIIGDIYEMTEYATESNDFEMQELVAMASAALANNVMSKTYMMSLSDTMKLFDGSSNGNKFKTFADYRLASAIPYSSFQYQMNQNQDEIMRELRTTTDRLKSRIYGQDAGAPKHDWLTGEAVATPEYMLGFIRQKKLSKKGNTTAEVYEELRNLDHAFVGPQRNIGDLELNAAQYQRYNELVGTVKVKGGDTLIEVLHKEINSSRYKRNADSAEINQPRSADDPRVKQLNFLMQLAKSKALRELKREFPKIGETVRQNAVNRKLMQNGRDAGEIVKNLE